MNERGILLHRSARIAATKEVLDEETGETKTEKYYIRKDLYQIHSGEKFILIDCDGGTLYGIYTAIGEPFEANLFGGVSKCIGIPAVEGIAYSVNIESYPLEGGS